MYKTACICLVMFSILLLTVPAVNGDVKEGEWLYYELNCDFCHMIGDEGRPAGPHLTGIGDRMTNKMIRGFLLYPKNYYPELSYMPSYKHLPEEEIESLVVFMASLKNPEIAEDEYDYEYEVTFPPKQNPTPSKAKTTPGFETAAAVIALLALWAVFFRSRGRA